ncbi:MAG TPA: hypothetical protein VEJ19_07615 [Nitrososphaerales archaeon]|nr:hypothetical protein [Nitrososphaerales archaeon]
MSASKLAVSRKSLRVCTICGAVYSTTLTKRCPACGELVVLSTELLDK